MTTPENEHPTTAEYDGRPNAHIDSVSERVYFADEEPVNKRQTAGRKLAQDAFTLLGLAQPDRYFPAAVGTMH